MASLLLRDGTDLDPLHIDYSLELDVLVELLTVGSGAVSYSAHSFEILYSSELPHLALIDEEIPSPTETWYVKWAILVGGLSFSEDKRSGRGARK